MPKITHIIELLGIEDALLVFSDTVLTKPLDLFSKSPHPAILNISASTEPQDTEIRRV